MLKKFFLIFFLVLMIPANLFAEWSVEGGTIVTPKDYDIGKLNKFQKGVKLTISGEKLERKNKIKKAKKKYEKALEYFLNANKENQSNVEILNYLGFISAKLGKYDNSEIYYLLVLSIDPDHLEANGLLGELYFKTNRVDLAKERLKILKNCNCSHYLILKKIIAN